MGKVALGFAIYLVTFVLKYGGTHGFHPQAIQDVLERWDSRNLDNNECEASSIFCRPPIPARRYQLVNVKTGKCISASKWFVARDVAEVINCQPGLTPFETFRIEDGKLERKRIVTAWFSAYKNDILDKCLTVSKVHHIVVFGRCDANSSKDWLFKRVPTSGSVVMLSHVKTRHCLLVDGGTVKASALCEPNDARFLWEFYDKDLSVEHILE